MDLGLQGARALVLASTSGLGLAVARRLVAEGTEVIVTGRDAGRIEDAARTIGARAGLAGDLSVPGVGEKVVLDAVEQLGGLDICVVNTGGGKPGGIMETAAHEEAAYHSMLRPALEVSRAAAPHLAEGGHARLLFLTARSVLEATPELALSSVMRSGVAAAARSLALELAPDVLVNVVATGQFDTAALQRFEQARSVAENAARRRSVRTISAKSHWAGLAPPRNLRML